MSTRPTRLAILAVLSAAIVTLGCDTTQPEQVGAQPATLKFNAQAKLDNYDCYEIWLDTDGDGVADTPYGVTQCVFAGDDHKVIRPAPWHYSLVISVLRAGTTVPEVLASSVVSGDAIPDFVSMTPYDTIEQTAADRPPEDGIYYLNGKRVSTGNEYYLEANGYGLGPPNVIEESPTYNFNVSPGDTIIVQARKQAYADGPTYLPTDQDPELIINGVLTVGGVQVVVNGDTASQDTDKAGVSFSFTRQ